MKTNTLFNKSFFLLIIIGFFSLGVNNVFSQQVKKKLVRVVEIDNKGERVVKEFNVTNDDAKYDSITRSIRKKIKIERGKMDSLKRVLMITLPNYPGVPPMPEMPDMPDFDFHIDGSDARFIEFDSENDFDFLTTIKKGESAKVYYSEKGVDKSGNLEKILEDLEKGTFDPQKWNMKEIEKDKIKDFKAKGKGDIIVLGNRMVSTPNVHYFHRTHRSNNNRAHVEMNKSRNGNLIAYFENDSLNKKGSKVYTIISSGDSDEEGSNKVIKWYGKHGDKGQKMAFYTFDSELDSTKKGITKTITIKSSDDSDEPNSEKVIVVTSDGSKNHISMKTEKDMKNMKRCIVFEDNGKTTNFEYTNPSDEDLKMLKKSSLLKEDKAKLLSPISLMLTPKKETDKYTISFQEKETGKVKVILTDDKGKTIKTEEFEHSKSRTEKEIEIKDLKSGVYFVQAQLNGKTTTSKLEIKID